MMWFDIALNLSPNMIGDSYRLLQGGSSTLIIQLRFKLPIAKGVKLL